MGDVWDVRGLKIARSEFVRRGLDISGCMISVKNGILYVRGEVRPTQMVPVEAVQAEVRIALKVLRQRVEIREVIDEIKCPTDLATGIERFKQRLADLRAIRMARTEMAKRKIDASLLELSAKNGIVYIRGILSESMEDDSDEQLKKIAKILRQRNEIREVVLDYRIRFISPSFEKQPFKSNRRRTPLNFRLTRSMNSPLVERANHRRQVDIGRLRLYAG